MIGLAAGVDDLLVCGVDGDDVVAERQLDAPVKEMLAVVDKHLLQRLLAEPELLREVRSLIWQVLLLADEQDGATGVDLPDPIHGSAAGQPSTDDYVTIASLSHELHLSFADA